MGDFFQVIDYTIISINFNYLLVRISIVILAIGLFTTYYLIHKHNDNKVVIMIINTISTIILITSAFLSFSMKFVEDKSLKNHLLFTSSLGLC